MTAENRRLRPGGAVALVPFNEAAADDRGKPPARGRGPPAPRAPSMRPRPMTAENRRRRGGAAPAPALQ